VELQIAEQSHGFAGVVVVVVDFSVTSTDIHRPNSRLHLLKILEIVDAQI